MRTDSRVRTKNIDTAQCENKKHEITKQGNKRNRDALKEQTEVVVLSETQLETGAHDEGRVIRPGDTAGDDG